MPATPRGTPAGAAAAASAEEEGPVAAVIGNNSWEVGVADLSGAGTRFSVSQLADSRNYASTVQYLSNIQPVSVLMPDSHAKSDLYACLCKNKFSVVLVARGTFNETHGAHIVEDIASDKVQARDAAARYLGRAAASALMTYVERLRGTKFTRGSLHVVVDPWVDAGKRMSMDAQTVKSLELVANRRTGTKLGSLLQAMDATRTAMGARLLRGQLISPLSDLEQIEARLSAVRELCSSEEMLGRAKKDLQRFPDLDRIASRFASLPKRFDLRELRAEIEAVRGLRQAIAQTALLETDLGHLAADIWIAQLQVLGQTKADFAQLAEEIDACVSDAAPPPDSKSSSHLQDVFCIKAEANGLLDAARCAYVCTVRDMEALVAGYRTNQSIDCELAKSASRGYHLSVPRSQEDRIPCFFVQAVRQKRTILCTTPELASLNNRQARVEEEILKLTVLQLARIRDAVVVLLPSLIRLSDAVALMDMLAAFAIISSERNYVCPTLGRSLALKASRHPVIDLKCDFTSNDVQLGLGQRLAIITGPNCVGKSTFLCQVGLICIMAHLGCFVPCASADIPLVHRICTRLSTDDALEMSASTFSLEMEECSYLLQATANAPPGKTTLVLIDELGRGTSTKDGVSIAWAVAEALTEQASCRALFSTHFSQLRSMASQRPERVGALRFAQEDDAVKHKLQMDDVSLDTVAGPEDYGIRLAARFGMPNNVVDTAREMRLRLSEFDVARSEAGSENLPAALELFKVLNAIRKKTKGDAEEARDLFARLQEKLMVG